MMIKNDKYMKKISYFFILRTCFITNYQFKFSLKIDGWAAFGKLKDIFNMNVLFYFKYHTTSVFFKHYMTHG